jgi:hypothetical protein
MMGTDEIQVAEFLKTAPNSAVTAREIARRVGGKKRLREDPDWIRPVLRRLLMDELIEADEFGQYKLKMRENSKATPTKMTMENFETWELVLDEAEASEQPSQGLCHRRQHRKPSH